MLKSQSMLSPDTSKVNVKGSQVVQQGERKLVNDEKSNRKTNNNRKKMTKIDAQNDKKRQNNFRDDDEYLPPRSTKARKLSK